MPHLIDADAFAKSLEREAQNVVPSNFRIGMNRAADLAREFPAIDAEPVVHCGECKYAKPIPKDKANAFFADLALVCGCWRGDYDVTHDISVTWVDGFCDEGEMEVPHEDG